MRLIMSGYIWLTVLFILAQYTTESHLPVQCSPDQFTCTDGTCISGTWTCDGTADCADGLDEKANCSHCAPGEFQCNNHLCVLSRYVCDGDDDCKDGSDESDCGRSAPLSIRSCKQDEFQCANKTCKPLSSVCDGLLDCADHSDEGGRCGECARGNGGCSSTCHDFPRGPLCGCPAGLTLGGDGRNCIDIDECRENSDDCSQICHNTIGSYQCACVKGYNKSADHGCKAEDINGFSLLFSIKSRLYQTQGTEGMLRPSLLLYMPGEDGGLAYDDANQTVFWADNTRYVIYYTRLHQARMDVKIHTRDTGRVDGMAIDWIAGNLYWTDDGKDTIEVAKLTGQFRRTLFNTGMDKPRDIVLDPLSGLMYWTDWGSFAKIERATMDGQQRDILVSSNISWPNGLTLDKPNNRLYWSDGKHGTIESVTLDDKKRRRSFFLGKRSHPFSVSVFGDRLFWTDWFSSTLEVADKRTGQRRVELLRHEKRMRNLRVIHPLLRQKGENPCAHAPCERLCLISPRGYSCACARGTNNFNHSTCTKGLEMKTSPLSTLSPATMTTTQISTTQGLFARTFRLPATSPSNKSISEAATRGLSILTTIKPTGQPEGRWKVTTARKSTKPTKKTGNKTGKKYPGNTKNMRGNSTKTPTTETTEMPKDFDCVFHLCAVLGECEEDFDKNCTCQDRLKGLCGNGILVKRRKEIIEKEEEPIHWIPFVAIGIIILSGLVLSFILRRKYRSRYHDYSRAVYYKKPPQIDFKDLYLHDFKEGDRHPSASSSQLDPLFGIHNPTETAPTSVSGHVNPLFDISTTSGESHESEEYDSSFHGNCSMTSTPQKESFSYRQITPFKSHAAVQHHHEFVNPIYDSPE